VAVRRTTRASAEFITFGPVDLTGAFTIALVIKRMANTVWHALIEGLTSANAVAWAVELSGVDNSVSMETGGTAVTNSSVVAADGWVGIVVSKPAGTSGMSLDLYKGSWAARTTTGSGNGNPASQTGGSIITGRYGVVSGDDADVQYAAAAIWNGTQLTQAQAQALVPGSAALWDANGAGAPTEHWEFNQASVGTSITGRKGVSSQTAITGTSVVTSDDPAASVYAFAAVIASQPRRMPLSV
jgi:hypothetical protein